jgi:hypothetical protein
MVRGSSVFVCGLCNIYKQNRIKKENYEKQDKKMLNGQGSKEKNNVNKAKKVTIERDTILTDNAN